MPGTLADHWSVAVRSSMSFSLSTLKFNFDVDTVYSVDDEYIVDTVNTFNTLHIADIVDVVDDVNTVDVIPIVVSVDDVDTIDIELCVFTIHTMYESEDIIDIVDIVFCEDDIDTADNVYNFNCLHGVNKPGLLFRLVRFATVACKDRGVLLLVGKWNRVLAVHLQPLVKLVLVYLPALAQLGCRNLSALQLHVERVLRHTEILCCFLYRHKTMPILLLLLILSVVKALQ